MKHCSICKKTIEGEALAILTMTAIAKPKYLCSECEALFEKATLSKSPEEISKAIDAIGDAIKESNNDDALVLETVSGIIENATERGELIKNGVYDFANDGIDDEESYTDVPEELKESDEDRMLDEEEERVRKKFDKIMNYVTGGAFAAAAVFIIYKVISSFL